MTTQTQDSETEPFQVPSDLQHYVIIYTRLTSPVTVDQIDPRRFLYPPWASVAHKFFIL
jgi:hypothetical protein